MNSLSPIKISYKPHIVGFLDVLGFSEKIRADSDGKSLSDYFNHALVEQHFNHNYRDLHLEVISDSIIIYQEYSPTADAVDLLQMSRKFLHVVCEIQCRMHSRGNLIRGGIAMGAFYKKGTIMVGPALLKAIELEKEAKVPMILCEFDSEQQKLVARAINEGYLINPVPTFLTDSPSTTPNRFMLASLRHGLLPSPEDAANTLHQVISHIKIGLSGNPIHFSKYRWLGRYIHQDLKARANLNNNIWKQAYDEIDKQSDIWTIDNK